MRRRDAVTDTDTDTEMALDGCRRLREGGDDHKHDGPLSADDVHAYTWKFLRSYFLDGNAYTLVKHQIDSYNDFVLRKMEQIIEGFNPVELYHRYLPAHGVFKHVLSLHVKDPVLCPPTICEKDGSTKVMMPNDARLRNLTYAAALHVTLVVEARTFDEHTCTYATERKILRNVSLGKIPVMVRSNYCMLRQSCTMMHRGADECRNDYGGYFIINGNEKVVISQDRISENKTYVFLSNKATLYSYIAEIRSVQENTFGVPKTTTLKLAARATQFGRCIRANIHHIKHDVPVFVLFKALGVESDRDICTMIVHDMEDPVGRIITHELAACMDEARHVTCARDALEYLGRYLHAQGHPREFTTDPAHRTAILRSVLQREFLPHAGPSFAKKALYLGYMVNKLMRCYLKVWELDDRDSYVNKRLDTPGVCLASLFRQYYGKVVKDLKTTLQREINSDAWRASNSFANVINKHNVYKVVKATIIESGLKYGLATGNWGMKATFMRQGVAQVLNRLTYMATVSHLRRVNTPIEKTGKLVQPRKLHSTQYGVICPFETPEGGGVGLVKNLAMSATVTIAANSEFVHIKLREFGTLVFQDARAFDMRLFCRGVKVFVNGDLTGVHLAPAELHARMRALKRSGAISVHTSIAWYVLRNEMFITTEGGRCIRPLYIVDNGRDLRLTQAVARAWDTGRIPGWSHLVLDDAPAGRPAVVEYLDVEEANCNLIAMKYDQLLNPERYRPTAIAKPPTYAYAEMDPSLMLGAMAGAIPFAEHNQAPRNTYQCLRSDQRVGMADGSRKAIADVRPGDSVMTLDPVTRSMCATTVTHQCARPCPPDKRMTRVETEDGSVLYTTHDHPFLTAVGWRPAHALLRGTASEALLVTPHGLLRAVRYTVLASDDHTTIADITVASKHQSFLASSDEYGALLTVHNSAMGKQAIGVYATNFRHRFDTMAYVMNYPQIPLVSTQMSRIVDSNRAMAGLNAVVAIACFTGFNQEDSVIINQSSIDRGLFASTFYRTYREQKNKNHSSGEEEIFGRPNPEHTHGMKPFNYGKLTVDGFVPENAFVESGDVIIGKMMPQKQGSTVTYKDTSVVIKSNERAFVDQNACNDRFFTNVNGDGYAFCKVRTRTERIPTIGDKFSSRHGQKGTLGIVYRQQDMPYTASGIVPDIVINPHAIPSRMTIGQLMECVMGKACCACGAYGDATPFTDVSVADIERRMERSGMEKHGNELMYNARTGEQIATSVFIGPTYYQRLKHMVDDKIHSRSNNGPVVLLTRQPAEGRARDGGLRLGEMEIECNWAHGIMHFLKERFMECSDNYRMFVCKRCGMMATVNPERNIYLCAPCANCTHFAEVRVPYAFKLLLQEIQTMGIGTRLLT